jgi:hypothetical protein
MADFSASVLKLASLVHVIKVSGELGTLKRHKPRAIE